MTRLNTIEAAKYLGVSVSYLKKLRAAGGGPKFYKVGKRVIYEAGELDRWLAGQAHSASAVPLKRRRKRNHVLRY